MYIEDLLKLIYIKKVFKSSPIFKNKGFQTSYKLLYKSFFRWTIFWLPFQDQKPPKASSIDRLAVKAFLTYKFFRSSSKERRLPKVILELESLLEVFWIFFIGSKPPKAYLCIEDLLKLLYGNNTSKYFLKLLYSTRFLKIILQIKYCRKLFHW